MFSTFHLFSWCIIINVFGHDLNKTHVHNLDLMLMFMEKHSFLRVVSVPSSLPHFDRHFPHGDPFTQDLA